MQLLNVDSQCYISYNVLLIMFCYFHSSTGHDECMILYGDSQGCINIIVINSAGECLRFVAYGEKNFYKKTLKKLLEYWSLLNDSYIWKWHEKD